MSDGTIHVEKNARSRLGANMTGGKIIVSGVVEEMMPTFTIDSVKPKVKIDDTESAAGSILRVPWRLRRERHGQTLRFKS